MTDKLNSNYGDFSGANIPNNQKVITLRQSPLKGDDPITWSELDNNFELLRYTLNSIIDELPSQYYSKSESDGRYQLAGTSYTKTESDAKYALTTDSLEIGDRIYKTAEMPLGRFEIQKGDAHANPPSVVPGGHPWNFAGTQAAMVVQVHHNTDIAENTMEPGAVFDFEVSGGGTVDPSVDLSTSIHWGVQSSTRKYKSGSAQCFTAVGGLYDEGNDGYNELGLFQGEATNLGSTHGTISGVEVLCKDGGFDTKINSVIGRTRKDNSDGTKQTSSFMASSEGSQPVGTVLTVNKQGNRFENGIDLSNADITERGAVILSEYGQIQNVKNLPAIEINAEVEASGGFSADISNQAIVDLAKRNVIALRKAIEDALCDPDNPFKAQKFTGVVKLPAGRIYLDEKIEISMPGTFGHNLPNSLTIQGVGMGNTQLCWINESSSHGMKIELGPYGATMSQKVSVRDVDFILGNQGIRSDGTPAGLAQTLTEGQVGAEGTALEINGNRLDLSVENPHASFDKVTGGGLKPSCLIENCNFMGWHFSHAGWNKCVLIVDAQLTDIRGCSFVSYAGGGNDQSQWWSSEAGIHITGDAKCTDYYLNRNRFFGFTYGILCDGNIEGVTCQQSTWIHSRHGIYWNVQEVLGGQAAYDVSTSSFTSGSTEGTPTQAIAQWPLLVVTDCHMNCNENNIYIQNGWQIIIKGCSFYGIDNQAAYGVGQPAVVHRSVYIEKRSSNVIIQNNTFSDVIGNDGFELDNGGWGPSIEINGHACLVSNNTFTIDPTLFSANTSDEPMVKFGPMASGNVVHSNMAITNLAPGQENGIPISDWNSQLTFLYEDNNNGSYNGVNILQNIVQGNF